MQEVHDDAKLSEAQKIREHLRQVLREREAQQCSEDQDTDEDVSPHESVGDLLFQGDDVSLVKAAELIEREGRSKDAFDVLPDTLTARGFAVNIDSLETIKRMLMTICTR